MEISIFRTVLIVQYVYYKGCIVELCLFRKAFIMQICVFAVTYDIYLHVGGAVVELLRRLAVCDHYRSITI